MKLFNIAAPLAVAGVLVLTSAHAQQPQGQDPRQIMPQRPGVMEPKSGMMDYDKMIADMNAADVRLEELTDRMNSAQGAEKMQAVQDVVRELVTNQVDMHRMARGMIHKMMPHK